MPGDRCPRRRSEAGRGGWRTAGAALRGIQPGRKEERHAARSLHGLEVRGVHVGALGRAAHGDRCGDADERAGAGADGRHGTIRPMTLDAVDTQDRQGTLTGGPMSQVIGRRWMVSAGHALAAQAAASILDRGGNAIDAGRRGRVHARGGSPGHGELRRGGPRSSCTWRGPARPSRCPEWAESRWASAEFFRSRCGGEIPVGLLRTVVPASPASGARRSRDGGRSASPGGGARARVRGAGLPAVGVHRVADPEQRRAYRQWPTSVPLYLPGGAPPPAGTCSSSRSWRPTIRLMMEGEAQVAAGDAPTGSAPRAMSSTRARSPGGSPSITRAREGCSPSRISPLRGRGRPGADDSVSRLPHRRLRLLVPGSGPASDVQPGGGV